MKLLKGMFASFVRNVHVQVFLCERLNSDSWQEPVLVFQTRSRVAKSKQCFMRNHLHIRFFLINWYVHLQITKKNINFSQIVLASSSEN